jgi:hypothetical protein
MPFTKESAAKLGSKGGKGVKNKTMSAASRKRYERAAAAAEKKAVAAKEFGSNDEQDAASQVAFWARARATKARARLGEGDTEEATAADSRRASARHALDARIGGSVAEVKPSPDDLAARAEAEPVPTVMEVALQEMRARKSGRVPRSSRRLVPALSQRARQTRRPRRSRLRARRVGLLRGRATTRMSRPTRSR